MSIAEFEITLKGESTAALVATVNNSQARYDAAGKIGDTSAQATEIERLQAAANILDSRGYYDQQKTGAAARPADEAGSNDSAALAVGLLVLFALASGYI